MFGAVTFSGFIDEIKKIAGFSAPSIKAIPVPTGSGKALAPKPASPVSPAKIIGKSLKSTNLQKTNYSNVNTKVQSPNISLTSEQKALQPPVVRS
jgi:hypothetical protein